MKNFLSKLPEQVKRLGVVLVVIVGVFLIATKLLVPESFGWTGHYRWSAVQTNANKPMQYAGQEACTDCHDDMAKMKASGFHKNLGCEVCHGPAKNHTEEPDKFKPVKPRDRVMCPVCHEYNPSRPTGFPQVVSQSHNPKKICVTCHNPHNPTPPSTPRDCSACHAEIANTKSVSAHMDIPCTKCHETPDKHRLSPRENLPTKPSSRDFCGQCHAKDAKSEDFIPRINMATHEPRYVCWQCHYPHLPEAQ